MDDKLKIKQGKLIEMVTAFGDEYLDEEYTYLSVELIKKMGRKREVPFKRGKLENWASGVVYTIGQLNFLFDDSFEPYASADDICDYFGTKKSTASNKARDIRNIFNLKLGNKEFSTQRVLNLDLSNTRGDLTQLKTIRSASRRSNLNKYNKVKKGLLDKPSLEDIENDDLRVTIQKIFDSEGEYIDEELIEELTDKLVDATFITPACGAGFLMMGDVDSKVVPAFTSMREYNVEFEGANIGPVQWKFIEIINQLEDEAVEGMVINPNIDNFFASMPIIKRALQKHPLFR